MQKIKILIFQFIIIIHAFAQENLKTIVHESEHKNKRKTQLKTMKDKIYKLKTKLNAKYNL